MKMGKLKHNCHECGAIDYCGNSYGFCLCTDERFSNLDDEEFYRLAEEDPEIETEPYEECVGCERSYCGGCEYDDLSINYFCKQMANAVYERMMV